MYPIILLLMIGCNSGAQKKLYYCPPCPFDCHDVKYESPGKCPVCNMDLVKREHVAFDGYQKKEIKINNKDIVLNAAFYTPTKKDQATPVVVIAHGSAPTTYDDVVFYTSLATELGMSVLAFDKRGTGKSTGTYQQFTVEESNKWFNLLASDILVCLKWVKKQPNIDVDKIGLMGGSQAGWIMPLAASQDSDVKFIISGEGVPVSAGEENYFSILTGDGSDDGLSIKEADEKLQKTNAVAGFDPRFILEKMDTKILWIFGTNDPVIPVDASLRALEKMDNDNFDVVVLPHGDHNFFNTVTNDRYDLTKYIRPWLKKIGIRTNSLKSK